MSDSTATSRSTSEFLRDSAGASMSDGRVPVVFAVTGHRSLRSEDEEAIAVQLRALFVRIRKEAPSSPMVLLSSLAEGADRLVARIALGEGIGLIAVLPLEQASYERDFADPESRDRFRELLLDPHTERVIVAPKLTAEADGPGSARDHQYLLAGLFVARNSDVLIALWDGAPARGTGGSSQIVAFRRTGLLDSEDWLRHIGALAPYPFNISSAPLDAPQVGLVYHIPVRRAGDAAQPHPAAADWLYPPRYEKTAKLRERFVRSSLSTLRHRDRLNREGASFRAHNAGRVAASAAYLTAGEATPSARDPKAPSTLAGLRTVFSIADALAIKHQRRVYGTMFMLFAMIAIATISLLFRNLATGEDAKRMYLAGYLLLLSIADVFYLRTRWNRSQDLFQDYRAIAEGLRVQFFWRLGGSTRAVSDYYLRKQRSELRWIRDVLQVCALRTMPLERGDFASVQRLWVKDQQEYYDRAGKRDGHRRRRQRMVGSALVLLSLSATIKWLADIADGRAVFLLIASFAALVLLAHLLYEIYNATGEAEAPTDRTLRDTVALGVTSAVVAFGFYFALDRGGPAIMARLPQLSIRTDKLEWMLAAIGISALIGTFAHAYANVRAFGEHQKQYERMKELFETAGGALARTAASADPQEADRVLFDLGCEALAEHADWLILHRARPIELPTAEL